MTIQLITPQSIPNGTIINGVANFWQNTPPSTRVDGSALVTGDRWYKPTDNGIPGTAGAWIRSGLYWVSEEDYQILGGFSFENSNFSATAFSTQAVYSLPISVDGSFSFPIYLVGCAFTYRVNSPVDANNYWFPAVFGCRFPQISSSLAGGEAVNAVNNLRGDTDATLRTTVATTKTTIYKSVESPMNLSGQPINDFYPTVQLYMYKTGSPGNLRGAAINLIIRRMHP